MTAPSIQFIGFDSIHLDAFEAGHARAAIESRAKQLRTPEATLRVHFALIHAGLPHQRYEVNLLLDHNGHVHASDKHNAESIHEAITLAFDALEFQIEKETSKRREAHKH